MNSISLKTLLFLCFIPVLSCTNNGSHKQGAEKETGNVPVPAKKAFDIDAPMNSARFGLGVDVPIRIKARAEGEGYDSLQLFVNGSYLTSTRDKELALQWNSKKAQLGRNYLRALAWKGGKNTGSGNSSFILLSDLVPKILNFKLIKTYPHDTHAYTQGLYYENGILYESTGQYGESSLRKEALNTGEVLQSVNLPKDIFGEGLAVYGNDLIQITWKSQVGFVYDKKTFQQINKVYYQDKEGWGITYNGKELIMSDGTEELSFYDTQYFTEQHAVQVYDNTGPVNYLNELEYIKGEVYANIYGQTRIAVIDPLTGKVKAYLDLASLVPDGYQNDNDRVLNGIAWNPATGHLYVTGKYWPSLFEISVY